MSFQDIDSTSSLPEIEAKILKFWDEIKAFELSNKLAEGRPEFIFYDGPPFATGTPHYGHILAGTIKDAVCRFHYQSGKSVPRVFGWDTHGLPVEHEVDKMLNITDKKQIREMGVDKYCEQCRSIVMRFSNEWRHVVSRTGRWIDFDNCYKTLDTTFMESVWYVFKQLWDKGDVYRGNKVMPYSVGCATPLSNSEAGLDYRSVPDPSVYVAFKLIDKDFDAVAWTTTPWTLPSNLALFVNPNFDYVVIETIPEGDQKARKLALLEVSIQKLYNDKQYKIIQKMKGTELVGIRYEPLFPYFSKWSENKGFRIYPADYVTLDYGTGIVHSAPGFGEEDYNHLLANGVISADGEIICPVDDSCKFTSEVPEYEGLFVKDADGAIIERLKSSGHLLKRDQIVHEYPFCWRSGTPLIYRCIPSWFVRVEKYRDLLIENTKNTYWVPGAIRDGRFINFLSGARDWAISRNRFWGTPIPVWADEEGKEFHAVGSIEELEKLSGVKGIKDLHIHYIDKVEFKSPKTGKMLKRIPEVFDCWFESGSMPFAQFHIPFSGKQWRQGDFIAEGLDQTRGWFYTLTVLSSLLGHVSPMKNVIVNGLIMAEDGKKMSKKLKNYPDPMDVMEKLGADALRFYLLNSPASHADQLNFKEADVKSIVSSVLIPLRNSLRFFMEQVARHGGNFKRNRDFAYGSSDVSDKWILSTVNRLVKFIIDEMNAYRLYSVLPELIRFIEKLNNWYIKLNRTNLKKENGPSLAVLFEVLYNLIVISAPYAPFFTEYAYQSISYALPENERQKSVHFVLFPEPNLSVINSEIENQFNLLQSAIIAVRLIRDKNKIPVRRPIKEVILVCLPKEKTIIEPLIGYLKSEQNILSVKFETDVKKHIKFEVKPNFKSLGQKLGKEVKAFGASLAKKSFEESLAMFEGLVDAQIKGTKAPEISFGEHKIDTNDLIFTRKPFGIDEKIYRSAVENQVVVMADVSTTQEILEMEIAREVNSRIQKARKEYKLVPTDKVNTYISTESKSISSVCASSAEHIRTNLKVPIVLGQPPSGAKLCGDSIACKFGNEDYVIFLSRAD